MTDVFTSVLHPFRGCRLGRRLRSIAALSAALFEVALRGFVYLNLPDMIQQLVKNTVGLLKVVYTHPWVGGVVKEDGTWVVPHHDPDEGLAFNFTDETLTNTDGAKYHGKFLNVKRPINGKVYTSAVGGAYRHDKVSDDDRRQMLEKELAELESA